MGPPKERTLVEDSPAMFTISIVGVAPFAVCNLRGGYSTHVLFDRERAGESLPARSILGDGQPIFRRGVTQSSLDSCIAALARIARRRINLQHDCGTISGLDWIWWKVTYSIGSINSSSVFQNVISNPHSGQEMNIHHDSPSPSSTPPRWG